MVKNEDREQEDPGNQGPGKGGTEAIPGCMKEARMQHPELLRLHVTSTHSTVQPESTIMNFQTAGFEHEAKSGPF